MANNNGQATFDAAFKSQEFFDKNKKILLGAIIAVVVIVAGYFCYSAFIGGPREEKQVRHWPVDRSISMPSSSTRPSTATAPDIPVCEDCR